jgi:zinc/manganese transport system substrate-binding protein
VPETVSDINNDKDATMRPARPARLGLLVTLTAVLAASACSTSTARSMPTATGPVRVVAAESFWGSIVEQLGGSHVAVTNIINSPDADPHDYEATPADGRAVASAKLVIINGVGYDTWATKLVAANPVSGRSVLTVGTLVGVPAGGNPHRWYDPGDVAAVIDEVTKDLISIDPTDAGAFTTQRQAFLTTGLSAYQAVIKDIKTRYAGTPVGASESIFALIAPALGLDLLTPPGFLTAISEGTDPTAADKATVDRQIAGKQIKVYVYNSQNATPDVQRQVDAARAKGIPVTTITETMTPAGASFQQWQTAQLVALRDALARATGR